ncbi:MAG: glycosyltransferase family 39 protein [Deltaproteobacteria bacterium]|nr:glycosyltransferase family 39 protein [Deltaproteobacteria bacterium]
MGLTQKQKRFIRENHQKLSIKKIARKLEIRPKDVRRALKELGIEHLEFEKSDAKVTKSASGISWATRIFQKCAILKQAKYALPLVVGLALLLRVIHLIEVFDTPFFKHLHTDPFMYHHWAKNIVAGDWLGVSNPVFYLGPAYPYFLAVIYSLFGTSPLAACLVQVLLSSVSAGLIYYIGRRLFGPVTGLLAGLLAATYAMYIFFSSLILGATLIVFLNLMLLALIVSGLHVSKWWKWILAGLFLGLSACARGNVLLFAPFCVFAIAAYFGFRAYKKWLLPSSLMTLATIVTILPVSLHNRLLGDDFVILTANAGANFFIGNNAHSDGIYMRNARYKNQPMGLSVRDQQANFPKLAKIELARQDLKPSEISSFWVAKTTEEICSDFGRWLGLLGSKMKYFVNAYEVPNNRNIYFSKRFSFLLKLPLITFGVIFPLGLLGMIFSFGRWRKRGLLTWYFLAHAVALLAFFVNGRYRLVATPVLLIFAAAMLRWLYIKISKHNYRRALIAAGFLALTYLATYYPVPKINYRANYLNLANAHRDLEQLDQAVYNYERAITISEDFYYAHFKKGQVLARMGQTDLAETSLNKALSLARRNNDKLNIGRIQKELQRLEKKTGKKN